MQHPNSAEEMGKPWTLFVDGSSTSDTSGAGVILVSPEGFKIQQSIKFTFHATNNEAEYEAIIAGLRLAHNLEVTNIHIHSDSQLIVKQVLGEFKTHNSRMAAYLEATSNLLKMFGAWSLVHVDRSQNEWADALSKLAASSAQSSGDPLYIEEVTSPSISNHTINEITSVEDWRNPNLNFIIKNEVPTEKNAARSLIHKARNYCIFQDKLYR